AGPTAVSARAAVPGKRLPATRTTGDGKAGDGPNAQKTWVDANIQITPATASNEIGTTHTLTVHVNVTDVSGFSNAPVGTTVTANITAGPGSFVGGGTSKTCTT